MNKNTTPLCIYHGNCADGFGAAWAVHQALGDIEYHPGVYQDPPPNVAQRDVIMVDFSYKRPVISEMAQTANSILILDHHKTAAEDLAGLPRARETWGMHLSYAGAPACDWIGVVFDQNRSGARIAWDYFHPGKEPPQLLLHIEDRDLWRFALPFTREIQANVFSYPYDFTVWDELMLNRSIDELIAEGSAIERKHFKDIRELVEVMRREMVIGGLAVPVANLPYTLTSDAGHQMAMQHPSKIGACYWDTPQGRVFSLRSTDDGPDVSAIAKQYGGGGHAHAAGFRVAVGWEGDPA